MNANFVMPERGRPIWLLATLVVFGLPATAFAFYPAVLATGKLTPDEDSIAIPMFGSILFAALMGPIVAVITYLCMQKYQAGARVTEWRKDKPIWSFAVSAFFLLPVLILSLWVAATPFSRFALQRLIWFPYASCCIAWCVALRSAALFPR
jgi:hypothetical protein